MEAVRQVPPTGAGKLSCNRFDEIRQPINGVVISSRSRPLRSYQSQGMLDDNINAIPFNEVRGKRRSMSEFSYDSLDESEFSFSNRRANLSQTRVDSRVRATEIKGKCTCMAKEYIAPPVSPKVTCNACINQLLNPSITGVPVEVPIPLAPPPPLPPPGPPVIANKYRSTGIVVGEVEEIEDVRPRPFSGENHGVGFCSHFDPGYILTLPGICEIVGFVFFIIGMILAVTPFQGGPYFIFIVFGSVFGWFTSLAIFCTKLFLTANRLKPCYRITVS